MAEIRKHHAEMGTFARILRAPDDQEIVFEGEDLQKLCDWMLNIRPLFEPKLPPEIAKTWIDGIRKMRRVVVGRKTESKVGNLGRAFGREWRYEDGMAEEGIGRGPRVSGSDTGAEQPPPVDTAVRPGMAGDAGDAGDPREAGSTDGRPVAGAGGGASQDQARDSGEAANPAQKIAEPEAVSKLRSCHHGRPCYCLCHKKDLMGHPMALHIESCCETCPSCGMRYKR